jgi:hypothetical protein
MPPFALISAGEMLAAIAEDVRTGHQIADIVACERVLEKNSRERFRYLLRSAPLSIPALQKSQRATGITPRGFLICYIVQIFESTQLNVGNQVEARGKVLPAPVKGPRAGCGMSRGYVAFGVGECSSARRNLSYYSVPMGGARSKDFAYSMSTRGGGGDAVCIRSRWRSLSIGPETSRYISLPSCQRAVFLSHSGSPLLPRLSRGLGPARCGRSRAT